jgi:hypothetical protein
MMIQLSYQLALVLHIGGGACALLLFWAPMLSRKGGKQHRNSGRWYTTAMTAVAASALILCATLLIDPVASKALSFTDPAARAAFVWEASLSATFLGQLAVMLYCNLHFGRWVLKVRAGREQLRTPRHLLPLAALLLISVYSGVMGVLHGRVLLPGFAAVGLFTVISNWRYVHAQEVPARAWQAAHIRNIIPSGIAAYTAFFVVGAASWIGDSSWRLLPWIAPGVIGSVFITYYSRQVLRGAAPRKVEPPQTGEPARYRAV